MYDRGSMEHLAACVLRNHPELDLTVEDVDLTGWSKTDNAVKFIRTRLDEAVRRREAVETAMIAEYGR